MVRHLILVQTIVGSSPTPTAKSKKQNTEYSMLKILKFAKYIDIIERIVGCIEALKAGAVGVPIRATFKGREFEIIVRRTK